MEQQINTATSIKHAATFDYTLGYRYYSEYCTGGHSSAP